MSDEIGFWKQVATLERSRVIKYAAVYVVCATSAFALLCAGVVLIIAGHIFWGIVSLVSCLISGRIAFVAMDRGTDISVYGRVQRRR